TAYPRHPNSLRFTQLLPMSARRCDYRGCWLRYDGPYPEPNLTHAHLTLSTGLLPPPCWLRVCPASSAFLVCKPTEFPSFLSCRRLSHESELLGSDPSLTIILAKTTQET